MIQNGSKPTPLDKRDYSFHRSFGAIPLELPLDFSVDIGRTMPDQNAEGLPLGCTGETQTDNATDEDNTIYKARYTYEKTCFMEGHGPLQGCEIRTSLKSLRIYGLQALSEETETEAQTHRRGTYFNIYDDGGMDWFDGIRVAVYTNKRGVSAGTPWFKEWGNPPNGILPNDFSYTGDPIEYAWHNYSIKGWKTLNGIPYLLVKSWQGEHYGDGGWAYMSRETANKVFEIRGSAAFTIAKFKPGDVFSIKIDMFEQILIYIYRILGLVRLN